MAVPLLDRALRRLQGEIAVLEVHAAFEAALRTRPRHELFALPDTHCNSEGYALLARLVAADAHRRLARQN